VVKFLLAKGAAVDLFDILSNASRWGHQDAVRLVVQRFGRDPVLAEGFTMLRNAVHVRDVAMLKLLIEEIGLEIDDLIYVEAVSMEYPPLTAYMKTLEPRLNVANLNKLLESAKRSKHAAKISKFLMDTNSRIDDKTIERALDYGADMELIGQLFRGYDCCDSAASAMACVRVSNLHQCMKYFRMVGRDNSYICDLRELAEEMGKAEISLFINSVHEEDSVRDYFLWSRLMAPGPDPGPLPDDGADAEDESEEEEEEDLSDS